MRLNIEQYPNKTFLLSSLTPAFNINIQNAVKGKLQLNEQLTNATALKIFKQIKWESDVLSFLAKPIVLIPLSVAICATSFLLQPTALPLIILKVFISTLSGGLVGYSLENSYNGFLSKLSLAYSEQSSRANEYIRTLENHEGEMEFSFVRPVTLHINLNGHVVFL